MIYFLQQKSTGIIKIGCTRQFNRRLATLTMGVGELELLGLMDGHLKDEHALHRIFAHLNVRVFKGKSRTYMGEEWFYPEPDLLAYIKANTSLNYPLPFRGELSERTPNQPFDVSQAALHFEIYHRFSENHNRENWTVRTQFVTLLRRKLELEPDVPLPKCADLAKVIPEIGEHTIRRFINGRFGYTLKPSASIVKQVMNWLGCTIEELVPYPDDQVKEPA